ncbi:hypothetical protein AB0451_36375 [Streptomyces sp. NPDC052000]
MPPCESGAQARPRLLHPSGAPASKSRRDKLTPEQRSVLAELGVDWS